MKEKQGMSRDMAEGKMQKNRKKKLTNVSFMYVCVAGNGEMLVYFSFFPNNSLNGQLSYRI